MSTPLRVLHVLGKLHRGGAETMVMNLYRNVDRNKIQFDFVVHTEKTESYEEEIEELGGRIFRVPTYKGYNHWTYVKSWKELLTKHPEFKIIHGHVRSTASIYLGVAKKYGRKTISHSHNTSDGKGIEAVTKRLLQIPIKSIADYLFAPTIEAGEWLFGRRATQNSNFHIIKNAINVKDYSFENIIRENKRKELGITDEIIVGHVGRFEDQKNHVFLIKIFKEFHAKNQNSILILVGKGPLESEIEDLVKDLKIRKHVRFLEERSDVNELMQAMDIFVFPSLYEGLGIVAIEAQAASLPVLTSNVVPGEVKLTENLEFKSLKSTAESWANDIQRLISQPRKDNSNAIISAGYDIKKTSTKLREFYLNLTGN